MKRILILVFLLVLFVSIAIIVKRGSGGDELTLPISTGQISDTENLVENWPNENIPPITVVAENLSIPWDIAFLPEGGFLVTERPGDLIYINPDGVRKAISMPRVVHRGEGGLLGIVLHPNFSQNRFLYVYKTVGESSLGTRNAVLRYRFINGSLSDEQFIFDDIPGAIYHDGGRMAFGPDGMLYITSGDATSPNIAQDLNSLGGKVLRVRDDGSIPEDNPFGTAVYSYGHRNSQGITWDDQGRMWSTEHGRSGVSSGLDELNLIVAGKNYGWPTIEGDATQSGMERAVVHSGPNVTWAPASAMYWDGSIFFGGLRGEALYEAVLDGDSVLEIKEHFKEEYGRIRTVGLGPDGMFYMTTSNTDGRGRARDGDDKIIRINPRMFR